MAEVQNSKTTGKAHKIHRLGDLMTRHYVTLPPWMQPSEGRPEACQSRSLMSTSCSPGPWYRSSSAGARDTR